MFRPHPDRNVFTVRATQTVVSSTSATLVTLPENAHKIRIKNPSGGNTVWIAENSSEAVLEGTKAYPIEAGETVGPIFIRRSGIDIYALADTADQKIYVLGEVDE